MSKADGEPLAFCAGARILCDTVQCQSAEARQLKTICDTVSKEMPSPRHCRMVLYTITLMLCSWKRILGCTKSSKSKMAIKIVFISDNT